MTIPIARREGSSKTPIRAHVLSICGRCRLFDWDIVLPGCTGRALTCIGPVGRSPEVAQAKRLAVQARGGRMTLIGGFAAR